MNNNTRNLTAASDRVRKLTAISLFCALAYICLFFIKFKVSFLTFDLKDAIMTIGAMYFGPVSAVVMPGVVSFLEFLTISDTGVYGLIMNFLASASFCLTASLIYKLRKKMSGAIIGLVSAAAVMTAVMMAANLFITPYYMGCTTAEVKSMIPTLLFPFNLVKGIVNASVVMLLYKPFSSILKASGIYRGNDYGQKIASNGKISWRIIAAVVSVAVLIASLLFLFLYLKASIA